MSGDNAQIQHNLAEALGMRMPGLGHTAVITAGPLARDSEEHILPLSTLPGIKTTRRTDVKVEYMGHREDQFSSPRTEKKHFRY